MALILASLPGPHAPVTTYGLVRYVDGDRLGVAAVATQDLAWRSSAGVAITAWQHAWQQTPLQIRRTVRCRRTILRR